ncbi:unnamed protein product, partial [Rotaria sordida]
ANVTGTEYPDGTHIYEFPNGQIEKHLPNGRQEHILPVKTKNIYLTDVVVLTNKEKKKEDKMILIIGPRRSLNKENENHLSPFGQRLQSLKLIHFIQ